MIKIHAIVISICVIAANFLVVSNASANCSGSDCLGALGSPTLNIKTQASCTQVGTESSPLPPTLDARWKYGLSTEVDDTVLGCDVIAHKIQWFGGGWTDWLVVGVNDLDGKYNIDTAPGNLRRLWSYFYDHNHLYIQCCDPHPGDSELPHDELSDYQHHELSYERESLISPWSSLKRSDK